MVYKVQCPCCGAQTDMDDGRDFMFCSYCGNQIANPARGASVPAPAAPYVPSRGGPTLVIDYFSSHPGVLLVAAIPVIRQKVVLRSGQNVGFLVPDGTFPIVLKIGRINHKRFISVFSANGPTHIRASWTGAPQILIDPA